MNDEARSTAGAMDRQRWWREQLRAAELDDLRRRNRERESNREDATWMMNKELNICTIWETEMNNGEIMWTMKKEQMSKLNGNMCNDMHAHFAFYLIVEVPRVPLVLRTLLSPYWLARRNPKDYIILSMWVMRESLNTERGLFHVETYIRSVMLLVFIVLLYVLVFNEYDSCFSAFLGWLQHREKKNLNC